MSLVKRRIDVTVTIGSGAYGDTPGESFTLTGLRMGANIAVINGAAQGPLQLRIFGLPLDMVNRLTTIGPLMTERRNNQILVAAGDDGSALATVYQGIIDAAWGDFQGAPDAVFNISALSAAIAAVKPVAASSYQGAVDVATIMASLAKTMGLAFENNGVSVKLSNPYLPGTALEQVKACARAADVYYTIDRGKLAIWPKDGARGTGIPLISRETGMIGYPVFSSGGIVVTTLFNPEVMLGGRVEVRSSLTVANGVWNVFSVIHELESEQPGGSWFTRISCYRGADGG